MAIKTTDSAEYYVKLYINEIMRFHGFHFSIISDRGPHFTSHFWKPFQKGLGTHVYFSTAFHPQTDGQAECTIQTLEDMLKACVIDFKNSWDDQLFLFSLPTIIATIPAFRWPLMRLYMGVDVDLSLVGLK